jgi:hypothetical protein
MPRLLPLFILLTIATLARAAPDAEPKPVVAIYPLAGDADAKLRDRVAFSLRQKLDRDGHFAVLDGYTMADAAKLVNDAGAVPLDADVTKLVAAVADDRPAVLIWGELDGRGELKVKLWDRRAGPGTGPQLVRQQITNPQDVRFVAEAVLEQLAGVSKFEHPSEESVLDDEASRRAWETNPNLLPDGNFAAAGGWNVILREQKYPPPVGDAMPDVDRGAIVRGPDGNRLVLHMSGDVAGVWGLACLSGPVPIEPETRYRIAFKMKSDGPTARVFVKGYTTGDDLVGRVMEREVYRRQVPPQGDTKGKWVDVVCDLNPQHVRFPVQTLRVDLYIYLGAGTAEFRDVVLKKVGAPSRKARDEAIDRPVTRPSR